MTDNNEKQFQQLIAKCWSDDAFKQALIADPAAVLSQEGIEVPAGVSVSVVENTATHFHLVIPPAPSELDDESLDSVAGGMGAAWFFSLSLR